MRRNTMTPGYTVEEYSELDFEHVTIETREQPLALDDCKGCYSPAFVHAGIWTCDHCGTVNHRDIEV